MSSRERPPLRVPEVEFRGVQLVEASAGTGKTRAIEDLYARLIAEGYANVDGILVVTYTKAATGELRDRLRKRLTAFERDPHDPESSRRVALAVREFDRAAVFTIHGFCLRVLADHAFDARLPFDPELVADSTVAIAELAEDFWRKELYDAPPLQARALAKAWGSPIALATRLGRYLGRPDVELRGDEAPETRDEESRFLTAVAEARARLDSDLDGIRRELDVEKLDGRSYKPNLIEASLTAAREWLSDDPPAITPPKDCRSALERLTASKLTRMTKAKFAGDEPRHPMFDVMDRALQAGDTLADAFGALRSALEARFLSEGREELRLRQRARGVRGYDDLLLDLRDALADPAGGSVLAHRIRERYPFALIDEFQDTDPIQFEIFARLYTAGDGTAAFLVGDPKQSIYAFRGADPASYVKAIAQAEQVWSLPENWRSEPELVHAVGELFAGNVPFAIDGLDYPPVIPAAGRPPEFLEDPEGEPAALTLAVMPATGETPDDASPDADPAIQAAAAAAHDVAELLARGRDGRARIVNRASQVRRPVVGGDVAVLVRSHRQGAMVREALRRLAVPCVLLTDESVFGSETAEEVDRLLRAVADPTNERRVRAALATRLLAGTAGRIAALTSDERAWERHIADFRGWGAELRTHGPARALRAIAEARDVVAALLALGDGERRATDFLHVTELLQAAWGREVHGVAALLTWLAERRSAARGYAEEAQLRLESDESAVQIATIHRSKGLQYGVVYVPFAWHAASNRGPRKGPLEYHEAGGTRRVVDLRAVPAPRDGFDPCAQADLESRADELRLLYVAVTRARHRCTLIWQPVRGAERSPLAWLLYRSTEAPRDARALAELAARSDGTIALREHTEFGVAPPAPESPTRKLAARDFPDSDVPAGPRFTSFSALAANRRAEDPDHDQHLPAPVVEPAPAPRDRSIHDFPAGSLAGRCVHAIFERVPFDAGATAERSEVVTRTLAEYGIDREWTAAAAGMVEATLAAPIDPEGVIPLRALSGPSALRELEFTVPIRALDDARVRAALLEHGFGGRESIEEAIRRLRFRAPEGFLRGYIDLVGPADGRVWVVDYKSNRLGPDGSAYTEERIAAEIASEAYWLQYALYLTAVQRYLRLRVGVHFRYDDHVGGVAYLFVRGIDPAGGPRGVYRHRPPAGAIDALDRALARVR